MKTMLCGSLVFFSVAYMALKNIVVFSTLWPDSWFLLFSLLITLASSTYVGALAVWLALKCRDDEREAAEYAEHLRRVTRMPEGR